MLVHVHMCMHMHLCTESVPPYFPSSSPSISLLPSAPPPLPALHLSQLLQARSQLARKQADLHPHPHTHQNRAAAEAIRSRDRKQPRLRVDATEQAHHRFPLAVFAA